MGKGGCLCLCLSVSDFAVIKKLAFFLFFWQERTSGTPPSSLGGCIPSIDSRISETRESLRPNHENDHFSESDLIFKPNCLCSTVDSPFPPNRYRSKKIACTLPFLVRGASQLYCQTAFMYARREINFKAGIHLLSRDLAAAPVS